MAEKSVGARIELKGEKEYSAAIKEAQRNLRVLRSELKAESAELGKNASEQDKNAAKAKSLKQQIQEQEKIVETMRAAMEAARREYGENSEAVAGWEIRLNISKGLPISTSLPVRMSSRVRSKVLPLLWLDWLAMYPFLNRLCFSRSG